MGLEYHGLTNLHEIYWNLPNEALYEEIIFRVEAKISRDGAIVVTTGKHTARSPTDKFVVKENTTEKDIWWGEYNRPFNPDKVQRTLQPIARIPARQRCFRSGLLRLR